MALIFRRKVFRRRREDGRGRKEESRAGRGLNHLLGSGERAES